MNVFFLSPGRTATTSIVKVFSNVGAMTAGHETRVKETYETRLNYPINHIEADNRLTFFMPQLTEKYGNEAVLVIVVRDRKKIAASYSKRWFKTNLPKLYAQGILLRDFSENTDTLLEGMVDWMYDTIFFFSKFWGRVVIMDMDSPRSGLLALSEYIDFDVDAADLRLSKTFENRNDLGFTNKLSIAKYALTNIIWDIRQCFR